MTDARQHILDRITAALSDVPPAERPADVPVARDYRGPHPADGPVARDDHGPHPDAEPAAAMLLRFAERVADYRAEVVHVTPAEVGRAVAEACAARGLERIAIPPGLPACWRPPGVELTEDDGLTARQLDELGGALTGCASAIAETGTLVLDGAGRCGRRLLTLVPDHHICVVEAGQISAGVPGAIAAVATAAVRDRRPITLISGPSASSDIELSRVEGVHGPRDLIVIIAAPATAEEPVATRG